jgi:3-methylfumaryl-CoA hydratase
MWAGSRVRFHGELLLGEAAERRSVVQSIEEKQGRTGPLVFVTISHTITGPRGLAIEEAQDLVFRDPLPPPPSPPPLPPLPSPPPPDWTGTFVPDVPTLFRFSALTMNGHRIHYDHPYVTGVEGYRGLVVHGPLTALLLLDSATQRRAGEVASFAFQARSPLFVDEQIVLAGRGSGSETAVWASGPGGQTAVEGTVGWR